MARLMPPIPASIPLCVDGRMLVAGATGVSRYAQTLVETLPFLGGRPLVLTDTAPGGRLARLAVAVRGGERRVVVTANEGGNRPRGRAPEQLRGTHIFRAAQVRFSLLGRMLHVRSGGQPGIMHWTYPVPIRMAGWINIYTVHDVIPLDRPELSGVDPVRLRAILTRIVASGDRVLTVSKASRDRIIAQLGIAPGRVSNCYQAVVPEDGVPDDLPPGLKPDGFFLYCGMDEPRKNLARLVAAHAASVTPLPLVLVGAGEGGSPGRVVRLCYQPRRTLAALQRHARAVLFPSLAEGFGLPVVEAMACGTPVLTSGRGALREVAGDAALLVDPEDEGAIARGIARLTIDDALCGQLAAAGLRRASQFSQARFAARLRAVYARAIAEDGRSDAVVRTVSAGPTGE